MMNFLNELTFSVTVINYMHTKDDINEFGPYGHFSFEKLTLVVEFC